MHFTAPSEHQVLIFLVQVSVLLGAARLLGQVSRRLGQPAVVGELAAGVLIGPSVFGKIAPDQFDWLFPTDTVQSGMLFTVGWLGVMMLLVVTGFETDLNLISRLGRAAALVTVGSLALPFVLGLGSGFIVPDSLRGDSQQLTFALFLAAALTISSLPVIAKILSELELLRRNFGQLTLAVGMANDVIGWVLLGLIAGLAREGEIKAGKLLVTIGALAVFLLAAALVGQRLVDWMMGMMRRYSVGVGGFVTVAIVFSLALGSVTQAIGVEGVLGAFIAGILLGRSRYIRKEAEDQLETFTSAVLAPVFFATAGLRVDLSTLGNSTVIVWAVLIVLIASIAKFVGSWAGARLARLSNRDGFALGAALNARGALEIIIATVGLSLGVLNDASYTIVVIMAIATSMLASPLLRAVTHNWPGSPDEVIRLKREERLASNVFLRPGRALVLADGRHEGAVAAGLAAATLPEESPMTILRAIDDPSAVLGVTRALHDRDLELKTNVANIAELTLQAGMGYNLAVTGTGVRSIDELSEAQLTLLRGELPVLLSRPTTLLIRRLRRIVLPLSASVASRAAAEVSIALAAKLNLELDLLYVRPDNGANGPQRPARRLGYWSASDPVAQGMFASVSAAAREEGLWPRRIVAEHPSRVSAILETANSRHSDLVVVGVEAGEVNGAIHLGQTAAQLLAEPSLNLLIVALGPR